MLLIYRTLICYSPHPSSSVLMGVAYSEYGSVTRRINSHKYSSPRNLGGVGEDEGNQNK